MVSFKVKDFSSINYGEFVSVFDIIVDCRKSDVGYFYVLKGVTHGSYPIFLEVGHFHSPDEAFEMVEYIEKIYPYLFKDEKNFDYILDIDFYPEFSAEAIKESRC